MSGPGWPISVSLQAGGRPDRLRQFYPLPVCVTQTGRVARPLMDRYGRVMINGLLQRITAKQYRHCPLTDMSVKPTR